MKYVRSSTLTGLAMCLAALSGCSDDDNGVTDAPDAAVSSVSSETHSASAVTETDDTSAQTTSTGDDESTSEGSSTTGASSETDATSPDTSTGESSADAPDSGAGESTSEVVSDSTSAPSTSDDVGTLTGGDTTSVDTSEVSTSDLNPSDVNTSDVNTSDVGTSADTSDVETTSEPVVYPDVPVTLPVSGCSGIGPLCTVVQDGGSLTANCGGRVFTGTVSPDRDVTLTAEPEETAQGATVTRSCEGELSTRGQLTAECTINTSAVGETPASSVICNLESDTSVLPSVECMEVPSELTDVTICTEGAASEGETIIAGTCHVVQNGCAFQAECENDLTLTGEVRGSELRFTRAFAALADAQLPSGGGEPAFLKGAVVNHSCIATVAGTELTGACSAGSAGRGGTATSVCSIDGGLEAPASCAPLAPSNELLFALDSCDPMKNGGEGEPGIGEPICAFRQNNCIWEIQCGRDMLYTGRIEPGDTSFDWRLQTGTQCEGGFTEAGEFEGVCAVPGLFSCEMWSKEPQPGGEACPSAPIGEDVTSRGCGNGSGEAMVCRELLWHNCDFSAICSFSYLQSLVFTGTASEADGAGRLDFTGIGDWECHVAAPTAEDLSSDPYRAPNEWIGQCVTEAGSQCRSTFNPEDGSGFRGLQLFWGPIDTPVEEP